MFYFKDSLSVFIFLHTEGRSSLDFLFSILVNHEDNVFCELLFFFSSILLLHSSDLNLELLTAVETGCQDSPLTGFK